MDEKTAELIAIGASMGARCQPCLTYHVGKAREKGAAEGEIREAMAVGQRVEKGAMSAMRQFVEGVIGEVAATGSSCCGGGKPKGKSCCG